MSARLALLGVLLATLPVAVDLPDSSRASRSSALEAEVAGGGGQLAFVSRGCNGEVLHVTHQQLASGALVVQQRLPNDVVIGVRGGNVRTSGSANVPVLRGSPTKTYVDSAYDTRSTNAYVNPYVGIDGTRGGAGVGLLIADKPFRIPSGESSVASDSYQRMNVTGHVRLGPEEHYLALKWMEDVPLESEGHLSTEFGFRTQEGVDAGVFLGMLGPYDGVMLGMRGRVWITPEAALQIKGSVAGNGQYGLYGSVHARIPAKR